MYNFSQPFAVYRPNCMFHSLAHLKACNEFIVALKLPSLHFLIYCYCVQLYRVYTWKIRKMTILILNPSFMQ